MNAKITVSMVAAAVAAISVAFVPASADQRGETVAAAPVAVVASAETPQDRVWDMTYGPEQPKMIAETSEAPAAEESVTVDLSMG